MRYIASFGAVFLFIHARDDVLSTYNWIRQLDTSHVKVFKAFNASAINILVWKQDSSGAQFPPADFPSQATPQPTGHASEKFVSFGSSVNMSCKHVKCLSHQHNSILAVEVSFEKAQKVPFDNFNESFFNYCK